MSAPLASSPGGSIGAPTLETERLRLRAHRVDDFAALATMWAEPRVYRHIGGKPSTPQEAWMRLLRYGGLWPLLGYGYWAVEEKASGCFIGDIGFADFKRDITPSIDGIPELGWALAPEAHGRGYASEAIAAICTWGDAHFDGHRCSCLIAPENGASIRVAEKAGFRLWTETVWRDAPTLIYLRG